MSSGAALRNLRGAMLRLLDANERSAQRLRVALYVLAMARYGRRQSEVVSINEMAKHLDMQPSNVSKALKALQGLGLWKIERAEDKRERSFYLVPVSTKKKKGVGEPE
jgi:DNA-binding transcriptional ArsR family regulator